MIYFSILSFFVLAYWLVRGLDIFLGFAFFMKKLKPGSPKGHLPKVSILFSARDEEKNVEAAVRTMLEQDYPPLEVVAVDDRSSDSTCRILDSIRDSRLKVVRVKELPKGWLGKNHALWEAYKHSSGEWLIFTDADVHMKPGTVGAAIAAAQKEGAGHLSLFPGLVIRGYFEAMFTNYFALVFNMRFRPWNASSPRSKSYVGIGAFNMVSREAYEKAGTHARIPLEIADDMMLGRIVKQSGAKSVCAFGSDFISVRWVQGFKGVMNALHKNAFRGVNFSRIFLIAATAGILIVDIYPYLGLFLLKGAAFWMNAASVGLISALYIFGARYDKSSWRVFATHGAAAALFLFVLWRSAVVTWREGGVRWRDTFYSLDELSKEPM